MKINNHAGVVLFIFTITASGLVMANCPSTMPEQLMEDCIVYEGAGASFPTSDYAHIDQYKNWQKAQQSDQPNKKTESKIK